MEESKTHYNINCVETSKVDTEYSDVILIKTCEFKNHLFQLVGTPDYKGRYSYDYEILRVDTNDTLKITNSAFFNKNKMALEKAINAKLKQTYEADSKVPELSECMSWIKFRHYTLDEFGISFTDTNEMIFNIDYGIGSACYNVSTSSVIMSLAELKDYLE
jgi:hypothetical protein